MQVTIDISDDYFQYFSERFHIVMGLRPTVQDFKDWLREDMMEVWVNSLDDSSVEDSIQSMFYVEEK